MLWTILITLFVVIALVSGVIAAGKSRQIRQLYKSKAENNSSDAYERREQAAQIDRKVDQLRDTRSFVRWVAAITGGIGVVLLIVSSLTMVSTKNVGIVTSFSKPTGQVFANGLHVKAPWQKVTEFDAAIQTNDFKGDQCTTVRLGTEGKACVENSVQWRIKPEAASELFTDYRSFEAMSAALVERQRVAALNAVFATFDPLSKIKNNSDGSGTPTLQELGAQATTKLQELLGDRLAVDSVVVSLVKYDEGTQKKLDAFQAQVGATRIAEEAIQTAGKEAEANRILANSVSQDPNVLVSKCLDTLNDMVKAGQAVPAGFSCWPGGNGAIVVPSTK